MTRVRVLGGLSAMSVAVLLLVGAQAATAQLPGGSAVDEYTENVPGAGGDHTGDGGQSNSGGDDTSGDSGGSVSPTGTDSTGGGATSPSGSGTTQPGGSGVSGTPDGSSGSGSGPNGAAITSSRGENAPATVTSQPTSASVPAGNEDSATEVVLPIAVGVVLLAIAGIYWYRRRYPEALVDTRTGGLAAVSNRLGP